MHKSRLEAFSDGVIAIIITIMVLELKVPHESSLSALLSMWPVFLSYLLSFVYLGIYWNNHHHLLQASSQVHGPVLWANLHLLFWLSLVPFTTAWMGENHFSEIPVAVYGIVLLFCAISYYLLVLALLSLHGKESILAKAIGKDFKGKISLVLYVLAAITAFSFRWLAMAIYVLVALIWLMPDTRIEKQIQKTKGS